MANAAFEREFAKGGFDERQAETLATAFNRIKHHPQDISTLKWAAGLSVAAVIAGFGWLGAEIRETRSSLETRVDGLETHVDGLETSIGDLAVNMARVQASLGALSDRVARIETLLDLRPPS